MCYRLAGYTERSERSFAKFSYGPTVQPTTRLLRVEKEASRRGPDGDTELLHLERCGDKVGREEKPAGKGTSPSAPRRAGAPGGSGTADLRCKLAPAFFSAAKPPAPATAHHSDDLVRVTQCTNSSKSMI